MHDDREHLASTEVLAVLAQYDLGPPTSVRELPRGSRRSPKLLLHTERGRFVLKRRATGRDKIDRARFSHELLTHLQRRGFPVPTLIAARDGRTLIEREGRLFELFEYVSGEAYDASLTRTSSAGETLARLHDALTDFTSSIAPPETSFHDLRAVRVGLNSIPTVASSHDSVVGHEAELLSATQWLHEQYDAAADAVNRAGAAEWPRGVIHGDWHPGNMLYDDGRVSVVLDLDSARRAPRVIDVANGMLQFSILRGAGEPHAWPAFFDEARMRRFLLGYQTVTPLPGPQRSALPGLLIESLIAESVVPIAATGSFGRMPGFGVLMMVRKKVRWILDNQADLVRWMLD